MDEGAWTPCTVLVGYVVRLGVNTLSLIGKKLRVMPRSQSVWVDSRRIKRALYYHEPEQR